MGVISRTADGQAATQGGRGFRVPTRPGIPRRLPEKKLVRSQPFEAGLEEPQVPWFIGHDEPFG
jgi:hypothetical protein